MEHLSIDDIHVERHCSAEIPAAVEDLTATKMSDTEVKLRFHAPDLECSPQIPPRRPAHGENLQERLHRTLRHIHRKESRRQNGMERRKAAKALHIYRVATANAIGDGFAAVDSIDMRKARGRRADQ